MQFGSTEKYIILALFALLVNIPFGILRAPCKKLSFKWFLYIHVSIPFIVLLRKYFGITWVVIPMTVTLAVLGQIIGAKIYEKKKYETKAD